MQTINVAGARLDAKLFIQLFSKAKEFAPARFLTLRLHPDRYRELYVLSDIPESIQIGLTPGPLGTRVERVNCIKPPYGVGDGVVIVQDDQADPARLVFEIHGIAELVIEGLAL